MATTTLLQTGSDADWFASWFDSDHYHRLYSQRDDREASGFLDRLTEGLDVRPGSDILDLGCGAGRHAAQLGSQGYRVTGIDLSAESLARARERRAPNVRFVRQDMREPFGARAYDVVLSLFTSFGYFEDAPRRDNPVSAIGARRMLRFASCCARILQPWRRSSPAWLR